MEEWIGVDLDGTLAKYEGWDNGKIGEPIPAMLERVKNWIKKGYVVKIVTARVAATGLEGPYNKDDIVFASQQKDAIEHWCMLYLGKKLEVTASKDFNMLELWDARAVTIEINTGKRLLRVVEIFDNV